MSNIEGQARLFGRIAVLRRQILIKQATERLMVALIAGLSAIAGIGLLNAALFLALRAHLGDVNAVLIVAGVHFLIAAIALGFVLRHPHSDELEALAQAEDEAFGALSREAHGLVSEVTSLAGRLTMLSETVALGIAAVRELRARPHDRPEPSPGPASA